MVSRRQILIIDDDAPTSRVLRLILEVEGYSCEVAWTRDEAIDNVERALPSLVIMDYVMRGLDPKAFIARLRDCGFGGPILLCTGFDNLPPLPVDSILMKPFQPEELVRRVGALLGGFERLCADKSV